MLIQWTYLADSQNYDQYEHIHVYNLQINLADNHIRKLPNDLSSLTQIIEFNVNGNPIDDLEAAVDSLGTMP